MWHIVGGGGGGIAAAERGETGEDGGPVLAATAGSDARRSQRRGVTYGKGRWIDIGGGGGTWLCDDGRQRGGGCGGGDGQWHPPCDFGLKTGTNPNQGAPGSSLAVGEARVSLG